MCIDTHTHTRASGHGHGSGCLTQIMVHVLTVVLSKLCPPRSVQGQIACSESFLSLLILVDID